MSGKGHDIVDTHPIKRGKVTKPIRKIFKLPPALMKAMAASITGRAF
jgi:hypothetical protein